MAIPPSILTLYDDYDKAQGFFGFYSSNDRTQKLNELEKLAEDTNTDFSAKSPQSGRNIFHKMGENNGMTRLTAISKGIEKAKQKNPSFIKALNDKCGKGETPLFTAAKSSNSDVAELFLKMGADPKINCRGSIAEDVAKQSWTGKNIKEVFRQNRIDNNLREALKEGEFAKAYEYLEKLSSNSNTDAPDGTGNSQTIDFSDELGNNACILVISAGKEKNKTEEEILRLLKQLYNKKCDINKKNNLNETSLYLAVKFKYLTILQFLLIEAGVDTALQDADGNTILHAAVKDADNIEIVEKLLKSTANQQINTSNKLKQTPLHFVKIAKVAEILCKAGAKVNAPDKNGIRPIAYIANLPERLEISKVLAQYDPDQTKPLDLYPQEPSILQTVASKTGGFVGELVGTGVKAASDAAFGGVGEGIKEAIKESLTKKS